MQELSVLLLEMDILVNHECCHQLHGLRLLFWLWKCNFIIESVFLPAHGYPDAKVALQDGDSGYKHIIDHSIFPEEGKSLDETGSVIYGENNITGYPVFVDTTLGNYRLGDLSPCYKRRNIIFLRSMG